MTKKSGIKIILCAGISVRSGTNYIGSIFSEIPTIDSLPKDNSKGEFPFFMDKTINSYDEWIANFNKTFFSDQLVSDKDFAPCFSNAFVEYLKNNFDLNSKVLFVKNPSLYNVERFYDFFPEGKLLILTRSAPDLIASSLKGSILIRKSQSLWKKVKAKIKYYSGYNMIVYCKAYNKHAEQLFFLRKKLNGNFLELKYEDVVNQPKEKIEEILKYCEIPFNDEIIEKAINAKVVGSSFFGSKKHSQNWQKMEKTDDFKSVGRYESWGFFNRFVFNRITKKHNERVGYNNSL